MRGVVGLTLCEMLLFSLKVMVSQLRLPIMAEFDAPSRCVVVTDFGPCLRCMLQHELTLLRAELELLDLSIRLVQDPLRLLLNQEKKCKKIYLLCMKVVLVENDLR